MANRPPLTTPYPVKKQRIDLKSITPINFRAAFDELPAQTNTSIAIVMPVSQYDLDRVCEISQFTNCPYVLINSMGELYKYGGKP